MAHIADYFVKCLSEENNCENNKYESWPPGYNLSLAVIYFLKVGHQEKKILGFTA